MIKNRDIFDLKKRYVFSLARAGLGLASQLFLGPVLAASHSSVPKWCGTLCVWHSECVAHCVCATVVWLSESVCGSVSVPQ